MLRATAIVRRPAVKADRVADTIELDHEARHRRRVAMTAAGGLDFLLDLDRATVLDDGDAVKLDDGRLVQVKAAPERLIEIRTDNPLRLMRVAWHIGNRHVAAEIGPDAIWIAHDHVLLEMVRGLGAAASVVDRPFRPEKGAYEGGHAGHDHAAHDHAGHDHAAHDHGRDHHAHDPACGCGHDHGAHSHAHAHAQAHADDHGHAHASAQSHAQSGPAHDHGTHGTHGHGHRHG